MSSTASLQRRLKSLRGRLADSEQTLEAIRTGKVESIDNYLMTNRDDGMQSFDESLRQLLRAGKITREIAELHVREPSLLNRN